MSHLDYLVAGYAVSGSKRVNPSRGGRAIFDGVRWCEVPNYHWARLTAYAGQMSMASQSVAVVGKRLVCFPSP